MNDFKYIFSDVEILRKAYSNVKLFQIMKSALKIKQNFCNAKVKILSE